MTQSRETMQDQEEFAKAREIATNKQGCRGRIETEKESRREKTHSTIIVNIASEIQSQTGKVGFGWSLKKEDDEVILTGARVLKAGQNTSAAELLAIQKTLVEAQKRRIQNIEVQLDVKTIVVWLQRKVPSVLEASTIIDNILLLRTLFAYCKFVFIRQDQNQDYHVLARQALSNGSPSLERIPSFQGGGYGYGQLQVVHVYQCNAFVLV